MIIMVWTFEHIVNYLRSHTSHSRLMESSINVNLNPDVHGHREYLALLHCSDLSETVYLIHTSQVFMGLLVLLVLNYMSVLHHI
jgi:hypothetical protein